MTIRELDLNGLHAFNLLLRCSDMESPFLLASALSFRAVSLSVFRLSLVVLGFSFFLLSVMAFFALGFCGDSSFECCQNGNNSPTSRVGFSLFGVFQNVYPI